MNFLLLLLISLPHFTKGDAEVAAGKIVYGNGANVRSTTDGKKNTAFIPTDHRLTYFFIDLEGIFDISMIELDAFSESKHKQKTLNTVFNVYTWNVSSSICELEEHYPWNLCRSNVRFTSLQETIRFACDGRLARTAQFIIIATGSPTSPEKNDGALVGELRAYGKKLRASSLPKKSRANLAEEDVYRATRSQLLRGVKTISGGYSKVRISLRTKFPDVVFLWSGHTPFAIAGHRNGGRFVVLLGQTLHGLVNKSDRHLRYNIQKWLSNGRRLSSIFGPSTSKKKGDIVLLTCKENFDLENVYRRLILNINPVLIKLDHSCSPSNSSTWQFVEMLHLNLTKSGSWVRHRPQETNQIVKSNSYVPLYDYLKGYASSWDKMTKESVIFSFAKIKNIKMQNLLKSPKVQDVIKQIMLNYRDYVRYLAPCDLKPTEIQKESDRVLLRNYALIAMAQQQKEGYKLPGVNRYPGQVTGDLQPTTVRVRINPDRSRFYMPTGAYANPGQQFTWRVVRSNTPAEKHYMAVGCVVDDGTRLPKWYRWNLLTHTWVLTSTGQWNSPVGGPIYLHLTSASDITLELTNVYRYPWLDVRAPDAWQRWEREKWKYVGVPRIHIVGDMMHSCVDNYPVSRMTTEDLRYAVTHYDNAVKIMHNYRGTDWRNDMFQIFTTDIQIGAGMGHSGNPFVIKRDWTNRLTEVDKYIKKGGVYGLIHEMGHNLQVASCTFRYGSEVTNVVYYLPTHRILLNLPQYEYGTGYAINKKAVAQMIERWKTRHYDGVRLSYYGYLGKLFGEGLVGNAWTRILKEHPKTKSEMERITIWITVISKETGYNLIPFHKLWSFPTDEATEQNLSSLPCYFPNDEISQLAPRVLVKRILAQYKSLKCIRTTPKKVQPNANYSQGINQIQKQIIFLDADDGTPKA